MDERAPIQMTGMVDFDPLRLRDFLANHVDGDEGRLLGLQRIGGGQSNPTYIVRTKGRRMVLRKQPAGDILKGAHAVDREYRIQAALAATAVPVPKPILFHDDPAMLGTPFYLMEFLDGRVFSDCSLAGLAPEERRAIYFSMAETLATLHSVKPDAVGLGDYGRHGGYFERQVRRWSGQLEESTGTPSPALFRLRDWIGANMPPDDGSLSIAHGDFRLGNLMFHPTEPRVIAVLDWELSTIGHPLADLGFCCMPWHTAPDDYGGILGLDHSRLGIPSEAEFVQQYREKLPEAGPLLPFHVAFALFRFAVIFVGIAGRAAAGNAADPDAARLAPLAARFAQRGLETAMRAG